jgi:hypothetical protein
MLVVVDLWFYFLAVSVWRERVFGVWSLVDFVESFENALTLCLVHKKRAYHFQGQGDAT